MPNDFNINVQNNEGPINLAEEVEFVTSGNKVKVEGVIRVKSQNDRYAAVSKQFTFQIPHPLHKPDGILDHNGRKAVSDALYNLYVHAKSLYLNGSQNFAFYLLEKLGKRGSEEGFFTVERALTFTVSRAALDHVDYFVEMKEREIERLYEKVRSTEFRIRGIRYFIELAENSDFDTIKTSQYRLAPNDLDAFNESTGPQIWWFENSYFASKPELSQNQIRNELNQQLAGAIDFLYKNYNDLVNLTTGRGYTFNEDITLVIDPSTGKVRAESPTLNIFKRKPKDRD